MHEVFLTAVVPDAEIERAKALLQGLSGMSAYASIHRVLYFSGPLQPRGLTVKRSIPVPLQPPQMRLWSELHQNLSRQSFVLQVRYPVKYADFGLPDDAATASMASTPMAGLNSRPATLYWTDIPDPTSVANGSNPLMTQRKKIEIADTKNLPAILQDNSHTFKSELVEEAFSFFTNGVEYVLFRHHRLPANTVPVNGRHLTAPLAALPPWEQVVSTTTPSVDPAGQWLLFVRRQVFEDTSPEKMAKAAEELESVRNQLAGVFVFRPVDRRAHDTRLERPMNNMPAPLPQKLRA